jgi:hypothetical protein
VFRYSAADDAWTLVSDESGVTWDVAEARDGELVVLDYFAASIRPYELETEAFGDAVHPPGVARFGPAVVADAGGRLLFIGGSLVPGLGATCTGFRSYPGTEATALVEAYDSASGTWATLPPLEMALRDSGAFATEAGIVVVGRIGDSEQDVVVQRLPGLPAIAADDPLVGADQEITSPGGCG